MDFEQWCEKNSNIGRLARSLKSSIPEQYVGFYLSKIFNNIEYQKQFEWLGRKSLDIYIPSLKLAIEYDGIYYHCERHDVDLAKISLCQSHGVRVFRIIEQEEEQQFNDTKDSVIYFYKDNYTNIYTAINALLLLINREYNLSVFLDVNLNRDEKEILLYVQEKYCHKTIASVWPESKDYWDSNANKCSIFDVFYTDSKKYKLKCPHCGRLFDFNMRYFQNRKSLIPCECEYEKIENNLQYIIKIYKESGAVITFDNSLESRRLYDKIISRIRYFLADASIEELELYKNSGFESPYFDFYISKRKAINAH